MKTSSIILLSLVCLLSCCKQDKKIFREHGDAFEQSEYTSLDTTSFNIRFAVDDTTFKFLYDSIIYESNNKINIKKVKGLSALEIKTDKEFSDTFINLQKLFGHTIDFSSSRYLAIKFLVPENSWISALKFNFKDAEGNFGGVGEIANNFYGNYGKWLDVVVDMQELVPNYKSWNGEGNPLSGSVLLSINPYNAHQADSSVLYIHSIRLGNDREDLAYTDALVPRIEPSANIPFKIDFDDERKLQRYMAYRSFESSYQAMRKGVAGNSSMAIRLKGSEQNKFIAFLPKLHEMTGGPVDFTKVKRIKFSYYLTENSDDFKGASLYMVTENWEDILYDDNIYSEFKKGKWQDVVIDIEDLNLEVVRGKLPVLPSVYELRLALEYYPGKKNIEMWLDNFEWE